MADVQMNLDDLAEVARQLRELSMALDLPNNTYFIDEVVGSGVVVNAVFYVEGDLQWGRATIDDNVGVLNAMATSSAGAYSEVEVELTRAANLSGRFS